ncbi:response regulator [Reichenbachiella carrageenanivorans]|uniref:Response regulator n=1 Tax=Reichenbachiella carrageenanivorans TaxID=2979869 RepID=A0ABY6CXC0_9BACT|nr:response regulator [Reichenbachiella carrageenanivorans]UXX78569.1 response regulator [Reichenbachiella carrageenanivorans]
MDSLKILLIEDVLIIAKDIKVTLEKDKYAQVEIITNPEDARVSYASNDYDLIISDINLNAEIDGIDLVKELCVQKRVPIVYLTAYSDAATVTKAEQSLPFAYLLKPYNSNQLKLTINLAMLNAQKEHQSIEYDEKNVELLNALTRREREILFILASGKMSKEIGDILNIATSTVEKHKQHIKEKLELKTLGELVNFAVSTKTVTID